MQLYSNELYFFSLNKYIFLQLIKLVYQISHLFLINHFCFPILNMGVFADLITAYRHLGPICY
jgi:hypothetical protein